VANSAVRAAAGDPGSRLPRRPIAVISEHDRRILETLPAWNPTGYIAAQRRAWEELAAVYNVDLPAIGALEENIELRQGLRADIAVPKGTGPHPVVIYLHGGGWSFGSPASFRELGMQFAAAGHLTINLDYRLAPEHPFPAALEDTAFAVAWASANARRWNGDGRRIAIGGDSSGANLAIGALVSIAPELRSLVRAAVLFYGVYDLRATAARTRALPGLQQQLSSYISGSEDLFDDPRASPLKAVAPGLLPPCFVIGAGTDTWCLSDSLTLAQALSAAESPYELHVMEGMPHGFMQMGALDGRRAAMRLMRDFLARNV
jgi:acetyl esterase